MMNPASGEQERRSLDSADGVESQESLSKYFMNNDGKIYLGFSAIAAILVALVVFLFWAGPQYNVYSQTKAGEARLKEAESSRQISILEARAKKESSTLQAEAEVERAKGVAKANEIIGQSLAGNPEYLQYLYITGLQEQTGSEGDRTVIYVPTEKGLPLPVLESNRLQPLAK
jgi:muramoyltetrapeptide carboxypeptidase LdcA involved in peptidoglycan recycling